MSTILLPLLTLLAAFAGAALAAWLLRRPEADARGQLEPLFERLERAVREEAGHSRRDGGEQARGQREELARLVASLGQQLQGQQESLRAVVAERLDGFAAELRAQNQRLSEGQQQFLASARVGREEQAAALKRFEDSQRAALAQLVETQTRQAETLRATVETGLTTLRQENSEKLDLMRRTVDEKLHDTLEKRLGDSFKLVSERLELVHKGLGEMQTLASGVGDLKRVLTNVKTRGGWGEVQLEGILEQMLTPEQFAKGVQIKAEGREMVDFAIRLPGRGEGEAPVWLPIDAKFPREDYERLIDAQERADVEAAKAAGAQLEKAVRLQAKSICDKYIAPPASTDFAVMFLPTEGLYAEVIRRPGMVDALQRECRVIVAGPTTITALLNSLQMGFKTLAIEKRSSEVWQVLGAVKTEFGKFGEVLDKVQKKLDEASKQIEQTGVRSRAITRKLREVQALPVTDSERLLGAANEMALDDEIVDG